MQETTNSSNKNQSNRGPTSFAKSIKDTVKDKAQDLISINEDHEEGALTKTIEDQTSKIPSGFFLTLAVGSMAISAASALMSKRKDVASFIGLWAPSFLLLGIYNKIVKTQGSDMHSTSHAH